MSSTEQNSLSNAVSKNFEIDAGVSLDEIKMMLRSRIQELLDTNMEKLLSILYRIDITQRVTDEIFSIESKEDIADKLAEAVIARQLEKIKTRDQYKNSI